jgi:hypothetical protein
MKSNYLTGLSAIAVVLAVGLGCSSLTEKLGNQNTAVANTAPGNTNSGTKPADKPNTSSPSDIEKADFTMTSEELDGEFNRKGVTDKDLQKYESKNIAVTGRVSMLVTEKKGTTQPWVTLYAPGIGNGVNCYFDDEHVGEMKLLKEDKIVKIQGFQDDFIVPEVSPMLKHCRVLEGAK